MFKLSKFSMFLEKKYGGYIWAKGNQVEQESQRFENVTFFPQYVFFIIRQKLFEIFQKKKY